MITADVIIIGGGMAGLSLAARIAPERRVVLIEQEEQPCVHASGRSAAVFVPNLGDALVRRLTALSRALFDARDPAWHPDPLLTPRGLLHLVAERGRAEHDAAMDGAEGVAPITLEEAARLFPILRPDRFVAAFYEADVHDIDAHALALGWMKAARAAGAELRFGEPVCRIARDGDAWRVDTPGGGVTAAVAVNAAGGWADLVAQAAGLAPIGLTPCRRSIAALPLPEALALRPRPPLVVPAPFGWYAKAEAARLLVSPADEEPVAPHDVHAEDLTLAEGLDRFAQDVTLEVTRVLGSWAGMRTLSPDGHPAIGFDPSASGFFWVAGQGGFGVQTAPALAEIAAAAILERDPPAGFEGLPEQLAAARFR